jgi:GPH family glycoside/pentoside/hexuronide:cation symporter
MLLSAAQPTGSVRTVRLSAWRLTAYGMMVIPLSTAGLPIAIYVAPLYTDHVGLGLTTVGLALMATRLLDLLVSPLIGRFSDATPGRFGRRTPWILVGVPLMMLGTWQVFDPQPGATGWSLFGWLSIFYLGWALITVPYGAWGAELSDDYHERSRIAGARELCSVFGLLFAVTLPLLVRPDGLATINDQDVQVTASIAADVAALGYATILLLPLAALVLIAAVPDTARLVRPQHWGGRIWAEIFRNKPFLLLLTATVLANLAAGMNQTTVISYYRHRAGLLELADAMIFVYFGAAVIGAFFWVWLGRRIAKHHAVAWAAAINLIFMTGILLVPYGDATGFMVVQIGSGFAYAGPLILGASMAADVIDLDWLRSGVQRSALFIAIWGIGTKLAEAAGVGIGLPMMDAMGFDPASGASAASQWALIVVNVILPSVFALAAIPFILAYPITENRQRIIRRAIERRLGRQAARDAHAAEEADLAFLARS